MKQRIAVAAVAVYGVTFLGAMIALCFCPGFFAVMTGCAVVAIICGSRRQRLLSTVLLLLSIAGFAFEYRAQRQLIERVNRTRQLYQQRLQDK